MSVVNDNIPFTRRPNALIALDIRVGSTLKHVGKAGRAPIRAHDRIAGRRILYKEAPMKDIWCSQAGRYSIDRIAFDYAVDETKVEFLVVFIHDEAQMFLLSARGVQSMPCSDLGERVQYRIDPTQCEHVRTEKGLNMGYTNNVRVVDDVIDIAIAQRTGHVIDEEPNMFGLTKGHKYG